MENKNIYQRMLAATAEINKVAKNLKVEITKTKSYSAVSEADVLEAVKPIEEKHGIYSYPVSRKIVETNVFTTTRTNDYGTNEINNLFMRLETVYRFVNIDKPDEFIDITTYGDGVDTQDKAPGKAMTYADKYALLKAYKIQTGEDPDAKGSEDMKKGKITKVQIAELEKLGADLNELAKYFKVKTPEEITFDQARELLERKKKQLEKEKAAVQKEEPKKAVENDKK